MEDIQILESRDYEQYGIGTKTNFVYNLEINKGTNNQSISIIGNQWYWIYNNIESRISSLGRLILVDQPLFIKQNNNTNLIISSLDVIHSFSLPSLGIKIDAIGEQGHYGLGTPDLKEVEASIVAFSELGVKVMITELDISVLPFPGNLSADVALSYQNDPTYNLYKAGLPDSVQNLLTQNYTDLFKLFIKHSDAITRVTFWGVNDANSWKNNWPVRGRTDYPLLFDRNNQPKPAFVEIMNLVK